MNHASDNWWVSGLGLLLSAIIIVMIMLARRGRVPSIRRIPGLNAIDEAVGRATEMGRPVVMIPGISGLDVITLQALSIFSNIVKNVAKYGNRVLLPTIDPLVTGIAEEMVSDAYSAAGRSDLMESNEIRYLSTQQFAFATSAAGMIIRENAGASFLFGYFAAESLILAEIGNQVGAVQIAGTTETNQVPFLIAACDYVIIGDEFYAASAYLSREPTLLASLVGQDYCKAILLGIVIIGCVLTTVLHAHTGPVPGHGFLHIIQNLINLFKS